jgi:hypothetical protein
VQIARALQLRDAVGDLVGVTLRCGGEYAVDTRGTLCEPLFEQILEDNSCADEANQLSVQ